LVSQQKRHRRRFADNLIHISLLIFWNSIFSNLPNFTYIAEHFNRGVLTSWFPSHNLMKCWLSAFSPSVAFRESGKCDYWRWLFAFLWLLMEQCLYFNLCNFFKLYLCLQHHYFSKIFQPCVCCRNLKLSMTGAANMRAGAPAVLAAQMYWWG